MMSISQDWIKRRWLDFRNGHGTYLVFAMAFFQFTIVTYTLAVERLPFLKTMFPSMSYWIGFFVLVYVPAAIIIGHVHLKKQVPTETKQLTLNNPYTFLAAPGKESLFNLPAAIIGYDLQLKAMRIQNQTADFYKAEFNRDIQRWEEKDFEHIQRLRDMAARLLNGESISEIVRDKK